MEFKDLINTHSGSDIIVAGCGESLHLMAKYASNCITIGVNDVPRLFHPTYLLIVDSVNKFNQARLNYIFSNESKYFFTHLDGWKIHNQGKVVKYTLGSTGVANLTKPDVIDHSNNSPYMAAIIAFKLGAKRIGMIGVDFTDNHFYIKDGPHSLVKANGVASILLDYERLHKAMAGHGVELYNLSPTSTIKTVPYMDIDEFMKKDESNGEG